MYFKFKPTQIFTGHELLDGNKVLIFNKNKTVETIVNIEDAGDDVQMMEGIISPKFINCHCHLELSYLKNIIPEKTGMTDFILQIINKKQGEKIEFIQECIANAEAEMIENGIVAVGDICNTTHTIKQKLQGNLRYYNFVEIAGFVPHTAQQRLNEGIKIYNQFAQHFAANSNIVPHAAYSVSYNLLQKINQFSTGKIASIHNQECADEDLFFKEKQGDFLRLYKTLGIDIAYFNATNTSSLQHHIHSLLNNSNAILVHNTFTQNTDMETIKFLSKHNTTQFFLCLCVIANRYINNCFPNFKTLFANTQNMVIGTDSLASNHELHVLKEIQIIYKNYKEIGIETLLKCATLNGAKALKMETELGSFEQGKTPGAILIKNFAQCDKPTILI
jgi:aminodeoxyfutalosine deaminase